VVVIRHTKRNNNTCERQAPLRKDTFFTHRSKREFWKEQTDNSHGTNC